MKRYFRFKVKHVLCALCAAAVAAALSYIFLPSVILFIGEKYHASGEPSTAKAYYDRIYQYFPNHWDTPKALERAAGISSQGNFLMVSPMGIGSPGRFGGSISKKALEYCKILAEKFPNTWQGEKAIKELTLDEVRALAKQGNVTGALAIIDNYLKEQTRLHLQYDVTFETARVLRVRGYYRETVELVEAFLENSEGNHSYPDLVELLADVHGALGNNEKALTYYHKAMESYKESYEESYTNYYEEKKSVIKRKISLLTTGPVDLGAVTGSITLSGKPLVDVALILQPLVDRYSYPMGSPDAIWSTSDQNGSFVFDNLIPGRYGLGFVVDLEIVGDVVLKGGSFPRSIIYVGEGETHHWNFELVETMKIVFPGDSAAIEGDFVEFAWEPYEGASYYTLDFGIYMDSGSIGIKNRQRYYESRARFSLEEFQSLSVGLSYDEAGPAPQSVLGYGAPGVSYFWSVIAHDEAGNILTASQGYLRTQDSDFSFSAGKLREGDKLLLEREYGKAIASYEKYLAEDAQDIHSLLMLARLYSISIDPSVYEYQYTNYDQSLKYYNQLYDLTGSARYLDQIVNIYDFSIGDYQKALETLRRIDNDGALSDWHKWKVAGLESHFGNYDTGLQELLSAAERFFAEEAALRIITGDFSGLTLEARHDQVAERWLETLNRYAQDFDMIDSSLKKTIRDMPAPKAITMLESREITAHEEFILLLLKVLDPTYKRSLEYVDEFIAAYASKDPELANYARILFLSNN